MSERIDVQYASRSSGLPVEGQLAAWAEAALEDDTRSEIVVRVVDEAESRELNRTYRHKDYATNVLSFPFEAPPGVDLPHLGDLVICAPVVEREAGEQNKSAEAHWAHMVVHGVLHLRGHDHETAEEADIMENLERRLLAGLGFPDPYRAID